MSHQQTAIQPVLPSPDEPRIREPDLVAGRIVLGRYRLLDQLGAGGFGVVWRALDESLGREVALKHVVRTVWGPPRRGRGAAGEDRARREALASARLAHPAIAALYEARDDGDSLFLISELVRGDPLSALIARGSLGDERIVAIGIAMCDALTHAHAHGVIHRDVTPANVIVLRATRAPGDVPAKLTDFGSALLAPHGGGENDEADGEVLGTLTYMAPEQRAGMRAGPHTDLFSLAVVLYEALSGVNPLRRHREPGREHGRRAATAPLARERPDLPADLTRAIDRALAERPEERGTLAELRDSLEGVRAAAFAPGPPSTIREIPPARRDALREPAGPIAVRRLHPRRPPAPALAPVALGASLAASEMAGRAQPQTAGAHGGAHARHLALPRPFWWAAILALIAGAAAGGRPGAALVVAAAGAPLLAMPRRASPAWLLCAAAPLLGLAGLAGAYPALASQARRWRDRAAAGALGYWWLALAQPAVGRTLWVWPAHHRLTSIGHWAGSLDHAARLAVWPLASAGTAESAALWAVACCVLPWLVRGRRVRIDLVLATAWSAGLLAAAPLAAAGIATHAVPAEPRGALMGAILGGALVVLARALRGPIRRADGRRPGATHGLA